MTVRDPLGAILKCPPSSEHLFEVSGVSNIQVSIMWQMLLNFGTCKCLHTRHGNLDVNNKMGDTVLGTTIKENDLGVAINVRMKV